MIELPLVNVNQSRAGRSPMYSNAETRVTYHVIDYYVVYADADVLAIIHNRCNFSHEGRHNPGSLGQSSGIILKVHIPLWTFIVRI